jgi:hypothetical protein
MANVSTDIQKLYVAYFSRPADVGGLQFWTNSLASGPGAYQTIAQNFSNSFEYQATYAGMDNRQVVDTVYQHLFGRHAEAAGIDYWAKALDQKTLTVANVVTAVADGAQFSDKVVIDGRVAAATAFTEHLDLKLEQLAYAGAMANKVGSDYLATIVDAQTAVNALLPGNIDEAISKFAGPIVTPVSMDSAEVVGVPPLFV